MMRRVWMVIALSVLFALPGAAWGQDCPDTVQLDRLEGLLKQAEKSIYLVQFDTAVVALDEAEIITPCLGEVATHDVLTRMFLYRGVVSYNQGNELGATQAFRRAFAIDPALQWNERFGLKPRMLFIDAKDQVISTARGRVRLPRAAEGVTIYVDGQLEPPEGGETEVYAGRHLLQVFKGESRLSGQWLEVAGGGLVLPPLPPEAGKMVQAPVASGPDSPSTSKGAWMRPAGVGTLAGGGALVAAGAVSGALYLQSRSTLEGGEYYANRDDDEKDALLTRNKVTAIVADVALPVGGILVGTGVSFLLMARGQGSGVARAAETVTPWVAPGGGGVALTLRF